eukprot:CAMPEP_0177489436 /NCGR_PEP_ID=MMETSP0369-20130122/30697_1 /TAXON_ID=447022 ORGANISM="Scrippsiella hangoei-like, Strain SHHI-4" /NCGR_SAMPLE_ID=MMETSP0369 /ASSEMBLY_ACC=CAM_ASM_000364 /LENGTH=57 /DNA_ID=CAMNT_0018965889 /DNA_START=600 /DNA_END=769 /DNA_ORIENTATION=-
MLGDTKLGSLGSSRHLNDMSRDPTFYKSSASLLASVVFLLRTLGALIFLVGDGKSTR